MADRRRIAIVGCGFIGGVHSMVLRGLIRTGAVDAQVVATCDSDLGRAQLYAMSHGAEVSTADPAIAMAAADVVWVCTPTATHRELIHIAAANGNAAYCEKPLAPNIEDAEALVAEAEDAGIPVQVGLVLRHSPALAAMADLLREGAIGRPMAAVLRDDQYFPIQGQYASTWRSDVSVAGGGTLIEHSIHDLDLLGWLLGPVAGVGAGTANFAGHDGI